MLEHQPFLFDRFIYSTSLPLLISFQFFGFYTACVMEIWHEESFFIFTAGYGIYCGYKILLCCLYIDRALRAQPVSVSFHNLHVAY